MDNIIRVCKRCTKVDVINYCSKCDQYFCNNCITHHECKTRNIKSLIGKTIGEASMCWSEQPSGVFESVRASKLVDSLYAEYLKLEDRIEELEILNL